MKTSVNNIKALLLLFVFLSFNAYSYENEKVLKKNYKADKNTELVIENSFGYVDVESTKGTQIEIEVSIWASGSSQDMVDKFINDINVNFREDGNEIIARTSNISNNGKVKKFKVNYTVKLPENLPLEVDLSFGELKLKDHKGRVEAEISHGSINASRLINPSNEIELKHSKGNIVFLAASELELEHSTLNVEELINLNLDNEFSTLKVKELKGDVKAEVQHGKFIADFTDKKFNEILLKVDFSEVKLNLSKDASYELTYKGAFSKLDAPDNLVKTEQDKGYTDEYYKGTVNGSNSTVKVKLSHSRAQL